MKKLLLKWHYSTFQRYKITYNVNNIKLTQLVHNLKHFENSTKNQVCFVQKQINSFKTNSIENNTTIKPINFCHSAQWLCIEKICLHVTSKKLLEKLELYNTFYHALSCIGSGQSPVLRKSKRSVAAYKLIKGHPIGVSSSLRNSKKLNFCYKWFFMVPAVNRLKTVLQHKLFTTNTTSITFGLDNIFIFELDRLNYDTFEPMTGLDIIFCNNIVKKIQN